MTTPPGEPKEQQVMLSVSASTFQRFMETAIHQSTLLALKVDELQLVNNELKRQLAELKKG